MWAGVAVIAVLSIGAIVSHESSPGNSPNNTGPPETVHLQIRSTSAASPEDVELLAVADPDVVKGAADQIVAGGVRLQGFPAVGRTGDAQRTDQNLKGRLR
jgi:hypothetical protein